MLRIRGAASRGGDAPSALSGRRSIQL